MRAVPGSTSRHPPASCAGHSQRGSPPPRLLDTAAPRCVLAPAADSGARGVPDAWAQYYQEPPPPPPPPPPDDPPPLLPLVSALALVTEALRVCPKEALSELKVL